MTAGAVPLSIAGPLNDVELTPGGLRVLRDGIFQISYQVTPSLSDANDPAQFWVVINNTIQVASSVTQTESDDTVTSSTLFSLLANDVVQLFAALPADASYRTPSLQIVQVG